MSPVRFMNQILSSPYFYDKKRPKECRSLQQKWNYKKWISLTLKIKLNTHQGFQENPEVRTGKLWTKRMKIKTPGMNAGILDN